MASDFFKFHNEAHAAGVKAAENACPAPMVVVGGVPGEAPKRWVVPEGVCGFAWIKVAGNSAFGRYAKKHLGYRQGYPKGMVPAAPSRHRSLRRR